MILPDIYFSFPVLPLIKKIRLRNQIKDYDKDSDNDGDKNDDDDNDGGGGGVD